MHVLRIVSLMPAEVPVQTHGGAPAQNRLPPGKVLTASPKRSLISHRATDVASPRTVRKCCSWQQLGIGFTGRLAGGLWFHALSVFPGVRLLARVLSVPNFFSLIRAHLRILALVAAADRAGHSRCGKSQGGSLPKCRALATSCRAVSPNGNGPQPIGSPSSHASFLPRFPRAV